MWSVDIRYIQNNSQAVTESGGVYKVLRDDGVSGKYSRVYVGKAENLRKRYLEHLSQNEPNRCLLSNLQSRICYFRYTIITNEAGRQSLESQMLSEGKYECNTQGQ